MCCIHWASLNQIPKVFGCETTQPLFSHSGPSGCPMAAVLFPVGPTCACRPFGVSLSIRHQSNVALGKLLMSACCQIRIDEINAHEFFGSIISDRATLQDELWFCGWSESATMGEAEWVAAMVEHPQSYYIYLKWKYGKMDNMQQLAWSKHCNWWDIDIHRMVCQTVPNPKPIPCLPSKWA